MIILARRDSPSDSLVFIEDRLAELGLEYKRYIQENKIVFAIAQSVDIACLDALQSLPGVEKVLPVGTAYKLVSRESRATDTVVEVGGVPVGGQHFQVIAGPCAVESESQLFEIALAVKEAGATLLRGGAYKPRTSPYSFQGMGKEGLKVLARARDVTGLPVVTEVLDVRDIPDVAAYADMLQIGSRNMQNYALLKEAAKTGKPLLLKRGLCATVEEWLLAAEYVLQEGNDRVVLCERGIRTFETGTRNTLDLSAVALLRQLTHLPVIVDPSHGTGKWSLVPPLARAAYPAGAHGLMIEVHHKPGEALSDGQQSLTPAKFNLLMKDLQKIIALRFES